MGTCNSICQDDAIASSGIDKRTIMHSMSQPKATSERFVYTDRDTNNHMGKTFKNIKSKQSSVSEKMLVISPTGTLSTANMETPQSNGSGFSLTSIVSDGKHQADYDSRSPAQLSEKIGDSKFNLTSLLCETLANEFGDNQKNIQEEDDDEEANVPASQLQQPQKQQYPAADSPIKSNTVKLHSQAVTKTRRGPNSIMHHQNFTQPSLIAPSKGRAKEQILTTFNGGEMEQDAINPQTMVDFHKLKLQAKIAKKQHQNQKRAAKIEERTKDVTGYRNLWYGYQDMQKQIEEKQLDGLHKNSMNVISNNDCHGDEVDLSQGQEETTVKAQLVQESFGLKDVDKWFVDFKAIGKEVKKNRQDDSYSQADFSLLSESTMEKQRRLFAEKKLQRMNKVGKIENSDYNHVVEGIASITPTKNKQRDRLTSPSTPQISPPKLRVLTDEKPETFRTAAILQKCDYGPRPQQCGGGYSFANAGVSYPSISNMEVAFRQQTDGNGHVVAPSTASCVSSFATTDDASLRTIDSHLLCDNEYKVVRRMPRRPKDCSNSPTSSTMAGKDKKVESHFGNFGPNQCNGVSSESQRMLLNKKGPHSLEERIASLERKLDNVGNDHNNSEEQSADQIRTISLNQRRIAERTQGLPWDENRSHKTQQTTLQPAQLKINMDISASLQRLQSETNKKAKISCIDKFPGELLDTSIGISSIGEATATSPQEQSLDKNIKDRRKVDNDKENVLSGSMQPIVLSSPSLAASATQANESDYHEQKLNSKQRDNKTTDLRERIVMRNALKCVQNATAPKYINDNNADDNASFSSIAVAEEVVISTKAKNKSQVSDIIPYMSTDEFLRFADDHALVRVVQLQKGGSLSFGIRRTKSNIESPTGEDTNSSFCSRIPMNESSILDVYEDDSPRISCGAFHDCNYDLVNFSDNVDSSISSNRIMEIFENSSINSNHTPRICSRGVSLFGDKDDNNNLNDGNSARDAGIRRPLQAIQVSSPTVLAKRIVNEVDFLLSRYRGEINSDM